MNVLKTLSSALAALTLATAAPTVAAQAAAWPTKPVRIVVPFPAGGSTDLMAREVAQGLTAAFGQTFIVENKGGAGSTIGTAEVARAAGDGYTFLVTSSHFAIVPGLYKLTYDPVKDMTGVSLLCNLPVIMIASNSLPAKTVQEVIAYAKANPTKVSFGSSGSGGVAHLSGEQFKAMTGTSIAHVPYKGAAPAMQDLLGGHVQLMFDAISTALPNIQSGGVKAIAWTGRTRSQILQNLPTIAESGVAGYESSSWLAMFAPAGTPKDVVRRVSDEVRKILSKPGLRERQLALGVEIVASTPEELDATVRTEMTKWGELIRKVGVKAE